MQTVLSMGVNYGAGFMSYKYNKWKDKGPPDLEYDTVY